MNVVFLSYKSFVNDLFLSKWRDRTFFKSIIFTLFSVLLCINFISEGVFKNAEDTRILFLMIVSLCIWSGIFNSISDISKMKDILSDDFERGISVFGFILAESFIQLLLCFIETIIVSVAIFFNYEFPDVQMIIDIKNIDYFVTVFLIFVAADFMGIMFSAMSVFVSSNNPFSFTMTIIPLLLLVQLLLSNVLVELKGSIALFVSHFSICKWGVYALEKIVNINQYPRAITLAFPKYKFMFESLFSKAIDTSLIQYWMILMFFIIVEFIMAYVFLKLKNNIN